MLLLVTFDKEQFQYQFFMKVRNFISHIIRKTLHSAAKKKKSEFANTADGKVAYIEPPPSGSTLFVCCSLNFSMIMLNWTNNTCILKFCRHKFFRLLFWHLKGIEQ